MLTIGPQPARHVQLAIGPRRGVQDCQLGSDGELRSCPHSSHRPRPRGTLRQMQVGSWSFCGLCCLLGHRSLGLRELPLWFKR
jgi:hypothetical protein